MKYYIVLKPLSNSDPYCVFASLKPLKKETILSEFYKQSTVKLMMNKDDAIFYAKSLLSSSDLCKPRGLSAPIIECEMNELSDFKKGKIECIARVKSSDKAEKHNTLKYISYLEIPRKNIKREMLTKILFPKKHMPPMDLKYESLGCRIA